MKAIITGISGQDGYFLSQLLLSKGYEVHGIVRRNSSMTQGTVDFLPENIREKIQIEYGDITDVNFLMDLMHKEKPDEIYHLAAQSFVGYSFQNALSTYDVNISGTLNICNAVRDSSPDTKLYFAATSELYGKPNETPQSLTAVRLPRTMGSLLPFFIFATDLVIFLVTNSGPLTSDSWLKSIPFDMNNLYASLYVLTVHIPASFDTA